MVERKFNEKNGLWYEKNGEYWIPCLITQEELVREPLGHWGRRADEHLKKHHPLEYSVMECDGSLRPYLENIDKQAREMTDTLMEQFKKANGITERLKAEDPMKWVGLMNNIRAEVDSIIWQELIYD